MELEKQVSAIEVTRIILPEIEKIIEDYNKDPRVGLTTYLDFMKRVKIYLEKIAMDLRDPREIGIISPRLLRDPFLTELITKEITFEEEVAHVSGYLKAILELVYCRASGLEVDQFTRPLNLTSEKLPQSIKIFQDIFNLLRYVRDEINEIKTSEQIRIFIEDNPNLLEKRINLLPTETITDPVQFKVKDNKLQLEIPSNDRKTGVPFTARLIAYYRTQEMDNESPLIIDPFAERLAGDLQSYLQKHRHQSKSDYTIVRPYFIEEKLLTHWCNTIRESQIVLLGAGMDTRAYRFKPLLLNKHTIFEVDFETVNRYKEEILQEEEPLCHLVRISADISIINDLMSKLREVGFLSNIPTFWILEGLVYYLEKDLIISLLDEMAKISGEESKLFVDVCVPMLAMMEFGPFARHFLWGIEKQDVPSFFDSVGWNVSCSFADDYNMGRDVGQRGMIFVHGYRKK
jgi:methyltransferase (TIGR00027 family)